MDKLDMDKPYLLTQAQRMDLLNSHNKLREIMQTIYDCNDIWMSQIQHLETLQCDCIASSSSYPSVAKMVTHPPVC